MFLFAGVATMREGKSVKFQACLRCQQKTDYFASVEFLGHRRSFERKIAKNKNKWTKSVVLKEPPHRLFLILWWTASRVEPQKGRCSLSFWPFSKFPRCYLHLVQTNGLCVGRIWHSRVCAQIPPCSRSSAPHAIHNEDYGCVCPRLPLFFFVMMKDGRETVKYAKIEKNICVFLFLIIFAVAANRDFETLFDWKTALFCKINWIFNAMEILIDYNL